MTLLLEAIDLEPPPHKRRVWHYKVCEWGEYGALLSWYPICDTGDSGMPRYANGCNATPHRERVTCKLCLRRLEKEL